MIATIEMVLTGSSENKGIEVWESMISSFRDYKLGTFLGTKFKDYATGEGGIKQTTEETIPLLTQYVDISCIRHTEKSVLLSYHG